MNGRRNVPTLTYRGLSPAGIPVRKGGEDVNFRERPPVTLNMSSEYEEPVRKYLLDQGFPIIGDDLGSTNLDVLEHISKTPCELQLMPSSEAIEAQYILAHNRFKLNAEFETGTFIKDVRCACGKFNGLNLRIHETISEVILSATGEHPRMGI